MKVLVVILSIACLFVCGGSSGSSEEIDLKFLKEIDTMLTEKFNMTILGDILNLVDKVKEKCPDLEDKLEVAGSEIESCLENVELGSETFCNMIKKNFVKCSKPVRELMLSCLPEKSKDLPLLGEKIVVAIIDQACNSTVEEILELFNPCALEKKLEDMPSCQEVADVLKNHKNELPSKDLICDMLPKVKKCAKDQQQATCKNPVTIAAHKNFYESIEETLKNECDSLNKT